MDPQIANFLTLLLDTVELWLTATVDVQTRFQEAFDRGVPGALATVEFAGELDHLDAQKLADLFAKWQEIIAVMDTGGREGWSVMLATVRSWNR